MRSSHFNNFKYCEAHDMSFITFNSTVTTVARYNRVPEARVRKVLEKLCDCGYVKVFPRPGTDDRLINTLMADWTRIDATTPQKIAYENSNLKS